MERNKPIIGGHQQLTLEWTGNIKAAKITLSVAGKNQNVSNDRWVKIIRQYKVHLLLH